MHTRMRYYSQKFLEWRRRQLSMFSMTRLWHPLPNLKDNSIAWTGWEFSVRRPRYPGGRGHFLEFVVLSLDGIRDFRLK